MKKLLLSLTLAANLSVAHPGEVTELPVDQVKSTLAQNKQEKILIFFTTWCSYCKPITLSQDLPKDKVVFISVDFDKDAIKNFAKDMAYNVYHVMPTEDMKNLVTLSESLGINFAAINLEGATDFKVPHISLLDKDNIVFEDSIQMEDLQKYLK